MSRLSAKLAKINCLQELYGFANRRKVLGISDENILPKWTEEERQLILARKYELERNNVGKKKNTVNINILNKSPRQLYPSGKR